MPRFQGVLMLRTSLLRDMTLVSDGRGWAVLIEFILRAFRSGARICSFPTDLRPRQEGTSKVANLRTIWSNVCQIVELRKKMN
jgi:hypothetical protein